jgi:hypothetical protein
MIGNLPSQTLDFLAGFFGTGNRLCWSDIAAGNIAPEMAALLRPLLQDLTRPGGVALLPRQHPDGGWEWYALGSSAAQARALREYLTAFVGPTYADFSLLARWPRSEDPVDAATLRHCGPHVVPIRLIRSQDFAAVGEKILLMSVLLRQRVPRAVTLSRPKGRLLRDFEMALHVSDWNVAEQALEALRGGGHLSPLNQAGLRVQLLARSGRWAEILALPNLGELLINRRPTRVTQAILQAVYFSELETYERQNAPREAIDYFRDQVLPRFGLMLRSREALRGSEILKVFLLGALTAEPPRMEACRQILSEYPADAPDRNYVEALAALAYSLAPGVPAAPAVGSPAPLAPVRTDALAESPARVAPVATLASASLTEQAEAAFTADDYDTAFELLSQCPLDLRVLRRVLLCADEIGTLRAAQAAIEMMNRATDNLRQAAVGPRIYRDLWQRIGELAQGELPNAETIPADWNQWIERLNAEEPWPQAVEVAQHGASEWPVANLLMHPEAIDRLAESLMKSRSSYAAVQLRDALPYLLSAFMPEDVQFDRLKPVYLSLLLILATDVALGPQDLVAVYNLSQAALACGLKQSGPNEYEELLQCLVAVWQTVRARPHLDWSLDVLDLLALHAVGQRVALDPLLVQVIEDCRLWQRHLRSDQRESLSLVCDDLGETARLNDYFPPAVEASAAETELPDASEVPSDNISEKLRGKTVAVYTLVTSVAAHVVHRLTRRHPGVDVRTNCEKRANDQLRSMAKNADYFLVATQKAKHAATDCIQAARNPDAVTLYAQGRGASSLIAVLYAYLRGEM